MSNSATVTQLPAASQTAAQIVFKRDELEAILNIYGRMVAAGLWRDYGIHLGGEKAVFAIYRRASEMPLYRIVKEPGLRNRQGAYAVIGMDGRVLKRGRELATALSVLRTKSLKLVE